MLHPEPAHDPREQFSGFHPFEVADANWEEVATAPPGELADMIRKAGLANQRARSTQGCLRAIHSRVGDYSLEHLRLMPLKDARAWLMGCRGWGRKRRASCGAFAS